VIIEAMRANGEEIDAAEVDRRIAARVQTPHAHDEASVPAAAASVYSYAVVFPRFRERTLG
jgi:hypothetical protein